MLREYIIRHIEWSKRTFGDGDRAEGLCKHIEKELAEIRAKPDDLTEWCDVIILAIDGAWRAGYSPVEIINALIQKQAVNFERKWVVLGKDQPTEHERAGD